MIWNFNNTQITLSFVTGEKYHWREKINVINSKDNKFIIFYEYLLWLRNIDIYISIFYNKLKI